MIFLNFFFIVSVSLLKLIYRLGTGLLCKVHVPWFCAPPSADMVVPHGRNTIAAVHGAIRSELTRSSFKYRAQKHYSQILGTLNISRKPNPLQLQGAQFAHEQNNQTSREARCEELHHPLEWLYL